jgi:serine palmitoyltransferase
LQEIVEECLGQGVWVTRAKRLKSQEMAERKPSIRIAVSAALTRKEVEKAAGVVKGACAKVLGRRR